MKTFQKALLRALIAGWLAREAAGGTETNVMNVSESTVAHLLDRVEIKPPNDFWARCHAELIKRESISGIDGIGWADSLRWLDKYKDDNYRLRERYITAGRNVVAEGAGDMVKEIFRRSDFVAMWSDRIDASNLSEFRILSIGGVSEGNLDVLAPTYTANGDAWWNETETKSRLRYGVRPLDLYAYFGAEVGPEEDPYALLYVRYRFSPLDTRLIESEVIVPISRTSRLATGSSFEPSDPGRSFRWSVRLEYVAGTRRHPRVLYAGLQEGSGLGEKWYTAGIQIPW